MRVLIIEDEPLVAKKLQKMLLQLNRDIKIIGQLSSVKRALNWFDENEEPDLIFSDIQLSDGLSFDIFEKYPPSCMVIFTTAYDEFALRAFEVQSIDYLLKPISIEDLKKSLEKYERYRKLPGVSSLQDFLVNFQQNIKSYKTRFMVHFKNAYEVVDTNDIDCFHKEELIFLYKKTGERLLTDYHSMEDLESLLNPEEFFRANRQFIIAIGATDKIKSTHKGLTVHLKNLPFPVDISREKVQIFKKWLVGE